MRKLSCFLMLLVVLFACVDEVALSVKVEFSTEIVNQDNTVPVQVKIKNDTEGADTYKWTFEGGIPSSSENRNPGIITYEEAGEYLIVLEAFNRDDSTDRKEFKINVKPAVSVGFEAVIVKDNFSPVEVSITNTTVGATSYQWTFEGGVPATSSEESPSNVIFETPGVHKITLEVSNGEEQHTIEKNIEVKPLLIADFNYEVPFEDDDFQVPVKMMLNNTSVSAIDYEWEFEGANITSSTLENPEIEFTIPGTYKIKLKTSNGKDEKVLEKTITVFENTNIRVLENIKLGINTAHKGNTLGAYFSTQTRKVYTKDEVTPEIGAKIDFAFFGLNKEFTFNKFSSPDAVEEFVFNVIPNATKTKFINNLELCSCGMSVSVTDFDNMVDDTLLKALTINETTNGLKEFDNTIVPRIVVFETSDNRKGVIKIKEFKEGDVLNSYILIDIKVQKEVE